MLRYLEAFFRNKWLIMLPALCLVFTGAGLVLLTTPKYGASATVWTERSTYLEIPGQTNTWITPAQAEAGRLNELLRTRTFSRAVADRVSLPEGNNELGLRQLASEIRGGLYAGPSGEHTLSVSFWHTDPQLALTVVQFTIEEYHRAMADSANRQAQDAIEFYKERIAAYETKVLPDSNGAVTDYLDKHPEVLLNQREGGPVDPTFVQLQRQAQIDRDQYERYQQRLDEVMTQSDAVSKNQVANFRVIDAPQVASGTGVLSKKTILVFAAGGAGVALGYASLFLGLATELDRTLRNAGDVKRRLALPVLDVVPDYGQQGEAKKPTRARGRRKQMLAQPVQSRSSM